MRRRDRDVPRDENPRRVIDAHREESVGRHAEDSAAARSPIGVEPGDIDAVAAVIADDTGVDRERALLLACPSLVWLRR